MVEDKKRKFGHELIINGPYWKGQISVQFRINTTEDNKLTKLSEIIPYMKDLGVISASGQYTYYDSIDPESKYTTKTVSESKFTFTGSILDDAPMGINEDVTTHEEKVELPPEQQPHPTAHVYKIIGVEAVDGNIKIHFEDLSEEELEVSPTNPGISLMSVDSEAVSAEPPVLLAEDPVTVADNSDDSKLITYGNLKAFAQLTDARYARTDALGGYLTESAADAKYAPLTALNNYVTTSQLGNGTVTIKQRGNVVGSFTLNQSGNKTIELTDYNDVYTHPTFTAHGLGFYKIQVNNQGHVIAANNVAKADITNLGIPGQDTTYSNATTTTDGLMSKEDKSKLDGVDTSIYITYTQI